VILYVDTSALVKVYVAEVGSPEVRGRIEQAEAVATALVTYAEARAAFARHQRERGLTLANLRRAVRALDRDWITYNVVGLSDSLVHSAGELAERHALRGYDAVQLAAVLELRTAGGPVEFCAFDTRLNRAARRERLVVSDI
jgi:predicted nucleic acid-binding protein